MGYYESEICRLASFSEYSGQKFIIQLARKGYYWQNEDNRIVCYLCKYNTHDNWEQLDDVIHGHKKFRCDCPVAVDEDMKNKPMKLLSDKTVKLIDEWSTSNSMNGSNSYHRDADNSNDEVEFIVLCKNLIERARKKGILVSCQPSLVFDLKNPDFELMKNEQHRLATFKTWSPNNHVIPKDLARNGLFYTGKDDKVQCAFCRGFLFDWESGDVVSDEHIRHFRDCRFARENPVTNESMKDGPKRCGALNSTSLSFGISRSTVQFPLLKDADCTGKAPVLREKSPSSHNSSPKYFADGAGPAISDEDEPSKQRNNRSSNDPPSEDEEYHKLLSENKQLREIRTCKICLDKEVNVVFLPCGHLVSCESCAPELRTCAICRALIRGTVKIVF